MIQISLSNISIALLLLILAAVPQEAIANSGDFVKVDGTEFRLNNKKWIPFGTFYRPVSSQVKSGPERDWIANYDPAEIERDLDLMKELGFNTVRIITSVYYHVEHQKENWATYPTPETSYKARMDDFLGKLGNRGMKAQIFIHCLPDGSRYGMDLFDFIYDKEKRDQSISMAKKFITECRLSNRPEILAYELDWEPHVGHEGLRNGTQYQGYYTPLTLWNRWIVDQYGSVADAEKLWGYTGQIIDSPHGPLVSAPTDEQVFGDGVWTRKSVAYRRFIEELINKRYAFLKEGIRKVDKNHLLMAQRVCLIGKVPHNKMISYPVRHTSAFLDYYGYTFSPHETWSLFDLDTYLKDDDLFTRQGIGVLYNKTNKPVIFDEFGSTTYLPDFPYTEEHLEKKQVLHYRRMFETAERFGADGMLAWWWIGKRPMYDNDPEVSDWGILRPDGTKKPVFDEIKSWSERMRSIPSYKPDSEIVVDDFAHADENDTYIEGKQLVLDAVKAGKHPKVITPYTGTNSRDCSLVCLCGLRSHTMCPKRALNAAFGIIEINTGDGFKNIEYGDTVKLSKSKTIHFRVSVANTAEALWLNAEDCGSDKGSVSLVLDVNSTKKVISIPHQVENNTTCMIDFTVPALITDTAEATLRMTSLGRCDFGEVFKFRLIH